MWPDLVTYFLILTKKAHLKTFSICIISEQRLFCMSDIWYTHYCKYFLWHHMTAYDFQCHTNSCQANKQCEKLISKVFFYNSGVKIVWRSDPKVDQRYFSTYTFMSSIFFNNVPEECYIIHLYGNLLRCSFFFGRHSLMK